MSLPQRIKRHQYSFQMRNKTIKYTPWMVRDEQEYMYATEGIEDKDYKLPHVEELLSKCVDDDIDFSDMSDIDFFRFAIDVRKVSKGSDHEVVFTCPNCETMNEPMIISLEDDVTIRMFNSEEICINDMVFSVREVTRFELATMKEIETSAQQRFEYVICSIASISVGDEIFTNLSQEEIRTFVQEQLTSEEYDELSLAVLGNTASIVIQKKLECAKCNLETLVYVDNISDFFD